MTDFPHVHFPHHGGNGPQLPGAKALDAIFALMDSADLPFTDAAQRLGVNPADIDPADFGQNFSNQSTSVQEQLRQGADALPPALRTVVDNTSAQAPSVPTPGVPGAPPSPSAPDVPAPVPPPSGDGLRAAFPDPGARTFPAGPNPARTDVTSPNISNMIQALFGSGAAQRSDAVQQLGPTLQNTTADADAARPDGLQNLAAMVQRFLGGAANANAPPPTGSVVQARADGNAANALLNQALAAPAQQQSAQQATGFAGQQVALADQQAQRNATDAPLGAAVRTGDGAATLARSADAAAPVATPDRTLAAQQQLQAQNVPAAHGRSDAMPAQVMTQVAGATMLANTQASMLPSQVTTPTTLSMPPLPPGNESAAAHGRENLILPAGHTHAGNLRRDLRGGAQALHKPIDWVLALIPGNAARREPGNGESASFQWVFWLLTVVTYGALAFAVVAMLPNRGGLTNGAGGLSFGAYALMIGGAAAMASWIVGRQLAKKHS